MHYSIIKRNNTNIYLLYVLDTSTCTECDHYGVSMYAIIELAATWNEAVVIVLLIFTSQQYLVQKHIHFILFMKYVDFLNKLKE